MGITKHQLEQRVGMLRFQQQQLSMQYQQMGVNLNAIGGAIQVLDDVLKEHYQETPKEDPKSDQPTDVPSDPDALSRLVAAADSDPVAVPKDEAAHD